MNKTALRKFKDVLKEHGLTVEHAKGGHYSIRLNGKHITATAHSSSNTSSFRSCVADLVKAGHLPESAKRIKF